MADMKMTPKNQEGMFVPFKPPEVPGAEQYPEGLRIEFNEDVIAALKLEALPDVNEIMSLNIKAQVVEVSKEVEEGKIHRCIELQIIDVEVNKKKSDLDLAKKLYGG